MSSTTFAGLTASPATLATTLAATSRTGDEFGRPAPEALEAVRRSGVLGLVTPARYGGLGLNAVELNRTVAEIARVDASIAIILFQHFAVSARIADWGTEAQKHRLLPRAADGEWIFASAWSETGAGANKRRLATRAEQQPDGSWVLNGSKSFATAAGVANLYLILAQSSAPDSHATGYGSTGQTFFLVEADRPGLTADLGLDLVGMRTSATGLVDLRSCRVGADAVLGPVGEAPKIISTVRESGATLGAVSVGLAEAAHDLLLMHVAGCGLAAHQGVRHRLVEIATRIAAAQAIVEQAGRRDSADPGMTTLHSKLFASLTSEWVIAEVARMLGSAGFLERHPINRIGRDARAVASMGPTNDLCRELVSAQCLS